MLRSRESAASSRTAFKLYIVCDQIHVEPTVHLAADDAAYNDCSVYRLSVSNISTSENVVSRHSNSDGISGERYFTPTDPIPA